jgi:uncharacterized protein (TIGR02996 family)
MRRFEFDDGKSRKFWEIAVDGATYTVRFGRLGTDGQTSTKVASNPAKAQTEADKLVREKTGKGYVEVQAAAAAPVKAGTHPELEAAILADPSDRHAWTVYADWLQAQGDVRGELAAVQLELELHPDDRGLRAREQALIAEHGRALLGDFASEKWNEICAFTWRGGFWRSARVWTDYDHSDEEGQVPKMVGAVLRHPSARFLEALEIGLADTEGECNFGPCVAALVKHGKRPGLRRLHVGAFEYPDETEISWTQVGSLAHIWAILPDLQDLTATGDRSNSARSTRSNS